MVTTIDYRGGESYGRTNCDFFGFSKDKPNVNVATGIDVDAFWDVVEEGIKCYDNVKRDAL